MTACARTVGHGYRGVGNAFLGTKDVFGVATHASDDRSASEAFDLDARTRSTVDIVISDGDSTETT
jgi:hypothetical protein